jgi:hypothetical protein
VCGLGVAFVELGQRQQHQDPPAPRPPARPRGLRPRRHLARPPADLRRGPRLRVPAPADLPGLRRLHAPAPAPLELGADRTVVYFPGSTIGNFTEAEAVALLATSPPSSATTAASSSASTCARTPPSSSAPTTTPAASPRPSTSTSCPASTASSAADFDLDQLRHRAIYDPFGRIEMHLVSRRDQTVRIGGPASTSRRRVDPHRVLAQVLPRTVRRLAAAAGLRVRQVWSDRDDLFSVQYLSAARPDPVISITQSRPTRLCVTTRVRTNPSTTPRKTTNIAEQGPRRPRPP